MVWRISTVPLRVAPSSGDVNAGTSGGAVEPPLSTFTTRVAVAVRPAPSRTVTTSVWLPLTTVAGAPGELGGWALFRVGSAGPPAVRGADGPAPRAPVR